MRATITITDNPDGRSCNVELNFDPPLRRLPDGGSGSPARQAVELAFAAIRQGATKMGRMECHGSDGSAVVQG